MKKPPFQTDPASTARQLRKPVFWLLVWVGAFSCRPVGQEPIPGEQTLPALVSVQQVDSLLKTEHPPVLIEVSPEASFYDPGHLPGARRVWRPDYGFESIYGGLRAPRGQVAALLGRLGVRPTDRLVVYDDNGSVNALRFRWLLRMYGHTAVSVMDGGKKAWEMAGLSLSRDTLPAPEASRYVYPEPEKREELAHLDDLLLAFSDTNTLILDTREPEEFHGFPFQQDGRAVPWKNGAYDYGRIPGAVHLNWSEAVELEKDHRFKPVEVIRYNVTRAGLDPGKSIIVYCQSGVRSAHTTFVLKELLGYPNVRNYDGSWIEWSFFHRGIPALPTDRELDRVGHRERLTSLEKELGREPEPVQ